MARDVAARLAALGDFGDVAGALRAVAAANVQQADTIRSAARDYLFYLETAIPAALGRDTGSQSAPALTVAFVAEHGFCAAFDEPVLAQLGDGGAVLFVGRRGTRRARELGMTVTAHLPMAAHPAGLDECVAAICAQCRPALRQGGVRLLAMQGAAGRAQMMVRDLHSLLYSPSGDPTTLRNLTPAALAGSLADEALYAAVFLCAVESFATENAARFARMDAACRRARDMAETLRLSANRERQDAISDEIFEIFSARRAAAS